MVLFLVALAGFGLPMSMLDLNQNGVEDELIGYSTGFWLFDALYNQYLLALGEFSTLEQKSKSSNERLVLLFFSGATFFTMITMLNMVIAIMGDSFDAAIENREKLSAKARLNILAAQAPSLDQKEVVTNEVYMILVKPVGEGEDEFEEESW